MFPENFAIHIILPGCCFIKSYCQIESCAIQFILPASCSLLIIMPESCAIQIILSESCLLQNILPESSAIQFISPESCAIQIILPESGVLQSILPTCCSLPIIMPDSCTIQIMMPDSCAIQIILPESYVYIKRKLCHRNYTSRNVCPTKNFSLISLILQLLLDKVNTINPIIWLIVYLHLKGHNKIKTLLLFLSIWIILIKNVQRRFKFIL